MASGLTSIIITGRTDTSGCRSFPPNPRIVTISVRTEPAHGRIDPSIVRSRDGVRVVAWSLLVLAAAAALQAALFAASSLGGTARRPGPQHRLTRSTAVPLADRVPPPQPPRRRWAGYAVVATIFVSACVAAGEAIDRLIHPQSLDRLRCARPRRSCRFRRERSRCADPAPGRCQARQPSPHRRWAPRAR